VYFLKPTRNLFKIGLVLLLSGPFALAQQYSISTIAGGVPPATPAVATGTSIGTPQRTTLDGAGNLYFTSLNSVFKLDTGGNLTLIAGTSRAGYSGDNGPAVSAELNGPQGLAMDSSGNLYIADSQNNVVRMVSGGIITTVVGIGSPGYSGDGGQATGAQLNAPGGMTIDKSNNLYIADTANNVIRLVTLPAGNIITFAGTLYPGYSGDLSAATAAQMFGPTDVAFDGSTGNVYIADAGNSLIRVVTTDGNINTYAGSTTATMSEDGIVATMSILNQPHGVAVDSSGNVYISQYGDSRIRKVTASKQIISTVAGTGVYGYTGDGAMATTAEMAGPWGISLDSSGNIYIADFWNYRVRKVSSSGTITTIGGNGVYSFSGDGDPAANAELNGPRAVAVDPAGNVYVADTQNNRVRQIKTSGVINTFAGNGATGSSGDGGPATGAQLTQPQALATDSAGNVYIADTVNNRIREVAPNGVITTIAGTGTAGYSGDGGPAASAQLNSPRGMAADAAGNLYIADFNNNVVRKISNGTITTVAGNGSLGFSGDGGPATSAQLHNPVSVAVDLAGDLYISDLQNYRIRMVTPNGVINTIAGNGTSASTGDGGPAISAQLAAPGSLAVDSSGNLYVADSVAVIREITPNGTIRTIAGNGTVGYSGDGGPSLVAQFNNLSGIAMNSSGGIYVADSGNNAIRMLQPVGFGLVISSVANSASLAGGPIAPGELVVLFGNGLGPAQLAVNPLTGATPPSAGFDGTRILFNGVPAAILYTWVTQVAAVVPASISGSSVQIVAQYQNQTSAPLNVPAAANAPGLFTANASGQGQASAINQDGTLNAASNPAKAGSTISLFATGVGTAGFSLMIGGQPATILPTGILQAMNSGLTEIAVQIPSGLNTGPVPVVVQAGAVSSQSGVTIAVTAGN
jgi:trimeric autotransporter adhesin